MHAWLILLENEIASLAEEQPSSARPRCKYCLLFSWVDYFTREVSVVIKRRKEDVNSASTHRSDWRNLPGVSVFMLFLQEVVRILLPGQVGRVHSWNVKEMSSAPRREETGEATLLKGR
jgi:hypothetical protein